MEGGARPPGEKATSIFRRQLARWASSSLSRWKERVWKGVDKARNLWARRQLARYPPHVTIAVAVAVVWLIPSVSCTSLGSYLRTCVNAS
ncbi:hypothetical protein E2562_018491 [Oryza meyeriana var. granulata]|uniref:Uncharacterized protein n=1 Tax=Oryza meyeriana var. granulata TaxID=110450 RepID=A0A6G1EMK0_9ORYZ|nr:hypothetical protein E2562_018491 [Oryza meyeriana var. granulata]